MPPDAAYARETFGLDYTQDETLLRDGDDARRLGSSSVSATTPTSSVQGGGRAGGGGVELDADRFVQPHDAEQHRLYLIPAGTPHASGAGNVVLEISATPYLYTLRFYDWLRRDLDGALRPVHVAHAFANLDPRRAGTRIAELMPEPVVVRQGNGCVELELGRHPDLFFAVHRLDFDGASRRTTRTAASTSSTSSRAKRWRS